MFKKNYTTTTTTTTTTTRSDTFNEAIQMASEQVVVATTAADTPLEVSNRSLTGYQWFLASINEFLSQISIIGQFHIFVQLCIAVAAIGSL